MGEQSNSKYRNFDDEGNTVTGQRKHYVYLDGFEIKSNNISLEKKRTKANKNKVVISM